MEFAPDGRLFVTQQGGQLRVIKNGVLLPTPFLTLTVNSAGERGLLGIAFDPNFAANQFIYVYYTATTPAVHNRISRFKANGDVVDTSAGELVLLDFDNLSSATNHNGGALHFGIDGKLYAAHGDNANGSNAQTLNNLLGKIIRMNPVSDPTAQIPTDNPFFATASGKNRLIWTLGLRNPFTFSIQPGTGLTFVNDVGEVTFEEINDARPGRNFGWPTTEGPFNARHFPQFTNPLYAYRHSSGTPTGCAITGGAFYTHVGSDVSGFLHRQVLLRRLLLGLDLLHRSQQPVDRDAVCRRHQLAGRPQGRPRRGAVLSGTRSRQRRQDRAERKRPSTNHATAGQSNGGGRRDRDVHGGRIWNGAALVSVAEKQRRHPYSHDRVVHDAADGPRRQRQHLSLPCDQFGRIDDEQRSNAHGPQQPRSDCNDTHARRRLEVLRRNDTVVFRQRNRIRRTALSHRPLFVGASTSTTIRTRTRPCWRPRVSPAERLPYRTAARCRRMSGIACI